MEHHIDLLDQPLYYPAFVSKLIGLSTGRIKRWLRGYEFEYKIANTREPIHSKSEPVIHRDPEELPEYASFLDLIDLLFVEEFLNRGFSLQKIRIALTELYKLIGNRHFAHERFFTFQKGIYVDKEHISYELLSGCQGAMTDFFEHLGGQIDFHSISGLAERWYPVGREKLVVIDPYVSFGRPTIEGTGINTESIFNLYEGEKKNIDKVAFWMNLNYNQITAAVDFELNLKAA